MFSLDLTDCSFNDQLDRNQRWPMPRMNRSQREEASCSEDTTFPRWFRLLGAGVVEGLATSAPVQGLGLWIRIHFVRIRIQQFFSLRIRM